MPSKRTAAVVLLPSRVYTGKGGDGKMDYTTMLLMILLLVALCEAIKYIKK